MPRATIVKGTDIVRSPRVQQVEGLFDIPPSSRSLVEWDVSLPLPEQWNVGVIVGPSGSGKTTVARHFWEESLVSAWEWSPSQSVLDGFPQSMSIKDITALMSSVGFSSPPAWLRPFQVLSTGEQFRVHIARTLAEMPQLAVVDEYTSVVDRTVAQIGSSAVAKAVRRRDQQLIAVTCHYDVLEWLEPDWIYEPATNAFSTVRLRRPEIELEIARVHYSAWELFKAHHYMTATLNRSAHCYVAFLRGMPVAFLGVLYSPGKGMKCFRGSRLVCLPDFQGVGIGFALSDTLASAYTTLGCKFRIITAHPANIGRRTKDPRWKMLRPPSCTGKTMPKRTTLSGAHGRSGGFQRMTAAFEYVGPRMPVEEAHQLCGF